VGEREAIRPQAGEVVRVGNVQQVHDQRLGQDAARGRAAQIDLEDPLDPGIVRSNR
jgi:hypothetical protein